MGVDGWDFPKPTIDDPESKKPSDWVDESMMADPEDKKPEGYDDIPSQIPDPDATKPDDWDDEDDGEWEPQQIDNPEYKGEWKPQQIANKDYDPELQLAAYDSYYVGYELWIVNNGTIFDNILVTDDFDYAKAQAEKLWRPTKDGEKDVKEKWDKENKPADDTPADDDEASDPEETEESEEPEKDEL